MPFYKCSSFTKLVVLFICHRLLQKHYRNQKGLQRSLSNPHATYSEFKVQSHSCFSKRIEPSQRTTLIFNVEGTLLKSPSLFPYFMLVAFEAGSVVRAFLLLILYPFLCLFSDGISLKIMVMVCFFGIKKEGFRVGSSVLPKFFLEDVGVQGFEVLRRSGEVKVGVTDMPQVMVESFLRDYLEIDFVIGRELKVVCGYYVGLMDDEKSTTINHRLEEIFRDEKISELNIIGLDSLNYKSSVDRPWISHCKEIYMVNEVEKLKWNILPREQYPKPLIFHDGRLAFRPTPLAMLAIFIWFPMGSVLAIIRIIIALSFPYNISSPLLAFTGIKLKLSKPNHLKKNNNFNNKTKGLLYVCNHRTLLDPLILSFGLSKSLSAVTYSLSRMSEILAPIRTVRLTRDRDVDGKMMDKMLNQGDLVVCPEGTTCREPYLLRLSPLFTELSDDIVPVGMDTHVDMFYGTTAGGLKCLDPVFFLMNPGPGYTVRFLDRVGGASWCNGGTNSRFEVANYVQSELGKALGFECTMLTRKDKYLILAGNEGIVSVEKRQ